MKRIVITLFLIMTLISSTAMGYAEEGAGTGPEDNGSETKVSTSTVKDDPLFGEIKGKYEQLKVLREEQASILEEIKDVTQANRALEEQLKNGLKRDKSEVQTSVKEQFSDQVAELKALIEQRKSLLDQVKALRMEAPVKPERPAKPEKLSKPVEEPASEPEGTPKGETATTSITAAAVPLGGAQSPELIALKEQIDALTVQIKEKAEALKLAKDSAAAGKDAASPLGQNMKTAHEQIKPLRVEVDAIQKQINTLQEEKHQEWVSFKADMDAKDLASASGHMSRILELKQEIINHLKRVLELKNQINVILKELVADLPESEGSEVKPEELKAPAPDFLPDELEISEQ